MEFTDKLLVTAIYAIFIYGHYLHWRDCKITIQKRVPVSPLKPVRYELGIPLYVYSVRQKNIVL